MLLFQRRPDMQDAESTIVQHWHLTMIQQETNIKMSAGQTTALRNMTKMLNHPVCQINHKNIYVPARYHYSNKRTEDLRCSVHLSVCYHTSQKSGPP